MFEKIRKECLASFDITVCGPLLIGGTNTSSVDPTLADDRTLMCRKNGMLVPVLPGSSIKGVFRNAICWDYVKEHKNEAFPENIDKIEFVNKIFGNAGNSTKQKSKISFFDAYAKDGFKLAVRHSAAINPLTHSTINGALFDTEYMSSGCFEAGFKFVNFTEQEMKAVLKVFEKINEGSVRFGGRTSRGFGKVKIDNFSMQLI
ncbi:MAG: RAMP superfamily CRISPR-associated protein, partial [Hominimerdicola sp.]